MSSISTIGVSSRKSDVRRTESSAAKKFLQPHIRKRNLYVSLFLILVSFIIRNTFWYEVFTHEIDHALAALFTGNIPLWITVNRSGGVTWILRITAMIFPIIQDFIATAGAGLGWCTAALLWMLFRKTPIRPVWAFFLFGNKQVMSYFGTVHTHTPYWTSSDFYGIRNLEAWGVLFLFLTVVVNGLAIWLVAVERNEIKQLTFSNK
jgi:hypothetical protein